MNQIFRKFIISVICFFSLTVGVFAAENKQTTAEIEKQKIEIQNTINNYILAVYKKQGDKILQDLDESLEKITSTKEGKIEAYTSIQATLRLKKKIITEDKEMKKIAQDIVTKYLNYMITTIEKKKQKL